MTSMCIYPHPPPSRLCDSRCACAQREEKLGSVGRRRITLKHFSPFVDPFISPPLFSFRFPSFPLERGFRVCAWGGVQDFRLGNKLVPDIAQFTNQGHCAVFPLSPCESSSSSFFYQCVCVFVLFFSFIINSRGRDLLLC